MIMATRHGPPSPLSLLQLTAAAELPSDFSGNAHCHLKNCHRLHPIDQCLMGF